MSSVLQFCYFALIFLCELKKLYLDCVNKGRKEIAISHYKPRNFTKFHTNPHIFFVISAFFSIPHPFLRALSSSRPSFHSFSIFFSLFRLLVHFPLPSSIPLLSLFLPFLLPHFVVNSPSHYSLTRPGTQLSPSRLLISVPSPLKPRVKGQERRWENATSKRAQKS